MYKNKYVPYMKKLFELQHMKPIYIQQLNNVS